MQIGKAPALKHCILLSARVMLLEDKSIMYNDVGRYQQPLVVPESACTTWSFTADRKIDLLAK